MKRSLYLLAIFTLLPSITINATEHEDLAVPSFANGRVLDPKIQIAPDHADWTYSLGEQAVFNVEITCDDVPVPSGTLECKIGPEKFEEETRIVSFQNGKASIAAGTMETPGFLRCHVTVEVDGREFSDYATAGFAPGQIQPTVNEPEDFDEFWNGELEKCKEVPLKLEKTLYPERCTPEVNAYLVSYQTLPESWIGYSRFYGVLTEPKEPGKYPAVLKLPGAGIRAYNGNVELAQKGVIVLELGIHGIPVNLPDSVYKSLESGALKGYPVFNIDNRELHYYHRVYLGCVRGNDVLVSDPMWDGKHLLTYGGSQGGQLSTVVAALDKRVTGNVSGYPAYCDLTGYLYGRAGGWPHTFSKEIHKTASKIETDGYYDTVNFARRLTKPCVYAWGYNDDVCPPTSTFAAYNTITAPKELYLKLEMRHRAEGHFWKHMESKLLELAGIESD